MIAHATARTNLNSPRRGHAKVMKKKKNLKDLSQPQERFALKFEGSKINFEIGLMILLGRW